MIENDLPTTVHAEKQLNELALAAGRKRQSPQTGFVHYFYHDLEETVPQTIPCVENCYFILALMRTKTTENMTEAKVLLDRLLFFQNNTGNFPIYLHEYPHGKDRFLGAQILPVFYYILMEFSLVLGSELKQRLQSSSEMLLQDVLKAYEEKQPSYPLGLKVAAIAKAFGMHLKNIALQNRGEALLELYFKKGLQSAWFIPASIADICIALQLSYGGIEESPWKDFATHLAQTWHRPTCTYIGPVLRQYQQFDEPQPTLYDLFLGYWTGSFSQRALKDAPFHLQAVLVHATDEALLELSYPIQVSGFLDQHPWFIYQEKEFGYSLLDPKILQNPAYANAFHPLYMVWGDQEKVHTFVCQGGNLEAIEFKPHANQIEWISQLAPNYEVEDREKSRELAFFFDIEPDVKITIHDETATTFHFTEEFVLRTSQLKVSLVVSLIEGEGDFLGHLMQGNRPSQHPLKGINRYKAYDWQLFFRTLRRGKACRLKSCLRIEPQ
jgi:hypothetical protein